MGGSARSDTRVLLDGGRVSIHAESARLAEVLSRFGQVTGTEIVFQSAQPEQLVSVGIETDSEAEALMRLLEGQGVNYVLRLDPTGREVEMIIITAKAAAAGSPPPGAIGARRPLISQERAPEEVEQTFEVIEEPDPAALSGSVPERQTNTVFGPAQPEAPAAASYPGMVPGAAPSQSSPSPSSPSPSAFPGPIAYPGRASYPGPRE
jgi:hypothetical protein